MTIKLARTGAGVFCFDGQQLAQVETGGLLQRQLTLYKTITQTYVLHLELTSPTGATLSNVYPADSALMIFYLVATDVGGLCETNHKDLLRQAAQTDYELADVLAELMPELVAPVVHQ